MVRSSKAKPEAKEADTQDKPSTKPTEYKAGLLTELFSDVKSNKRKREEDSTAPAVEGLSALQNLFTGKSVPPPAKVAKTNAASNVKKEVKKENAPVGDHSENARRRIEAKLAKKEGKVAPTAKKGKKNSEEKKEDDPERRERTIFVGNVLLNKKPKDVIKLLELTKAEVEAVYFRSLPVHPKWMNKRRSGAILKDFSGAKETKNAYVVLKEKNEDLFKKCLAANGKTLHGTVVRVDRDKAGFSKFDRKRTVFCGNLLMTLTENELQAACAVVGPVKAVRIVRDKTLNLSKGFGFVQFEDRSAVTRALQELDGKEVRGRPMRVTRALDEEGAKEEDQKRLKKAGLDKKKEHPMLRRMKAQRQRKVAKRVVNRAKAKSKSQKNKP